MPSGVRSMDPQLLRCSLVPSAATVRLSSCATAIQCMSLLSCAPRYLSLVIRKILHYYKLGARCYMSYVLYFLIVTSLLFHKSPLRREHQ